MPTATAASTLYTLYRPRSGVMIYDSKTYALSARSLRSRPVGCLNRQEGSLRVLEQGMPTYTLGQCNRSAWMAHRLPKCQRFPARRELFAIACATNPSDASSQQVSSCH